jgi:imidazole glycerol-phosphate synthase subunit HisF
MSTAPLFRTVAQLSVEHRRLVRTEEFRSVQYLGDPSIAARILSDFNCDELIIVDISATVSGSPWSLDQQCLAEACRCPLTVGGAVRELADVAARVAGGAERVSVNSLLDTDAGFARLTQMCEEFGSSTMVASFDVRRTDTATTAFTRCGSQPQSRSLDWLLKSATAAGVGEVLIQDINRNGRRLGFDAHLLDQLEAIDCAPIMFGGGARHVEDFAVLQDRPGFSAGVAGTMFSVIGPHDAPLVRYTSTPSTRTRKRSDANGV